MNLGNLIFGSSAFSKPSLNVWKFLVHIMLKLGCDSGPLVTVKDRGQVGGLEEELTGLPIAWVARALC